MIVIRILGAAALILGIALIADAKSAMHEITAMLCFVVFTECVAVMVLGEKLERLIKVLSPSADRTATTPAPSAPGKKATTKKTVGKK